MFEASKTLTTFSQEEKQLFFSGTGIDIGCGADPIAPHFTRFDKQDGDANNILTYFSGKSFHCVFSSHCLEHMQDPKKAIQDWWQLVEPGGYLVVAVPDEDLYEQGVFPSRWNDDHKWTFTIYKEKSWCDRSINIKDLIKLLDGCNILKLVLQDKGYDYSIKNKDQTRHPYDAMAQILLVCRKV